MTIKQKIEDNLTVVLFGIAVAAFGSGWVACEKSRVESKTEKIADLEKKVADQSQQLKDGNAAIEPYKKQIDELLSNTRRLELELGNSRNNLNQWQQAIGDWKSANEKLQSNLNLYASNCNVISMIQAIERKKDLAEHSLATAYSWDSEKPKIEDYKRQVSEYQARLLSLNEKLACQAK